MILLDSNVLPDLWGDDPIWYEWSSRRMREQFLIHELAINPVIYAEISVRFTTSVVLDKRLDELGVNVVGISRSAAFLAGKAYAQYRRQGGTKGSVLADFFIGAHALVLGCSLLTRNTRRYRAYFPGLRLIAP